MPPLANSQLKSQKSKYTAFWNGLETIIMTSVQWVIGRVVQKIMEVPAFLLCYFPSTNGMGEST